MACPIAGKRRQGNMPINAPKIKEGSRKKKKKRKKEKKGKAKEKI
jgi:hypothetical protein